jgi:hypothetical protein
MGIAAGVGDLGVKRSGLIFGFGDWSRRVFCAPSNSQLLDRFPKRLQGLNFTHLA